jgi:excisionase family DNA binding protein
VFFEAGKKLFLLRRRHRTPVDAGAVTGKFFCFAVEVAEGVFLAIAGVQSLVDSAGRSEAARIRRPIMTKLTEYVKTAEAAEMLGVAQNTLRKWAERGDIPMCRNPANGYRLFKRRDLAAFLKRIESSAKKSRGR